MLPKSSNKEITLRTGLVVENNLLIQLVINKS